MWYFPYSAFLLTGQWGSYSPPLGYATLPTCLPHTVEASHCLFLLLNFKHESWECYSLWFDLTGNRTRVYRFSSRCYIHSTNERLYCMFRFDQKTVIRSVARDGGGYRSPIGMPNMENTTFLALLRLISVLELTIA